jgi:hypothetical protein
MHDTSRAAAACRAQLVTAHGASRWMREGRVRAALGNTPDTSKGLRKLRSAGVLVRRGAGGRADPFRYMLKSAFLALSPDAQRAPPPPDDDADDDHAAAEEDVPMAGAGEPSSGRDAPEEDVDMAPCGAHDASDADAAAAAAEADAESDGSTCDDVLPQPPAPPTPRALAAALTAAMVAGAEAAVAAMPAEEQLRAVAAEPACARA